MSDILGNKRILFFLVLILFGGFLLRVINLTILPVFVDEAIYIRWSQIMRVESQLRFLPLSDGKQPLFMWLTIPFFKVFSDPLFAGRFVSVLSGLGTTFGVFCLTFAFFNSKKAALGASLLYAISPFSVFFDRLALADSLLTFFGVWSLFFGYLTVQTKRLDTAMIAGFFLGGALLTKSPALFFTILLPFLLAFQLKSLGNKKTILKYLLLFGTTYVIAYGLYNILRLGPNFHLISMRNQDYVYPLNQILLSPLNPLIPHLGDILNWFFYLGPLVLFLFIPVAGVNIFRKHKTVFFVLLSFTLFPLFIQSVYAKVFTARYILFIVPYVFIFSAGVFLTSSQKLKKITKILLIAFSLMSVAQNYLFLTSPDKAFLPKNERSGYLEEWTAGYGIKEIATFIRQDYLVNKNKIVVGTEGYFGTLPDGLQIYLNDIPQITIIGVGLGIKDLPSSLLESKAFGNKTFFVINDSRLLGEPAEMGMTEISSYPKAKKQNGLEENLKLFEVN